MSEPGKKDLRPLATGLCAVAAACLIYAAFTHAWLVNASRYAEIGFGLRTNYECGMSYSFDGAEEHSKQACEWHGNSELIKKWREMGPEAAKLTSGAFAPTGWITFIVALLAAAGLAAAAAFGALKKPMTLPIAPTTVALLGVMIGLITGCVFVATKPGPAGMVGVGLSFWIFGVGCVMGIAGAQMMAKVNRPPDPDWTVE
ncbi:MAG TPA: hypothetical protein VIV11_42660 [Kofleriaceae bacterium]